MGEHARALTDCAEALRLRRSLGDQAAVAETANNLGLELEALGRTGEASRRFREALAINERLGDEESVVVNLGNLGALAIGGGRYSEAMRLYRRAAGIAASASAEPWAREQLRIARINQGVVLEKVGDLAGAVALYKRLLAEDDGGDPRQRAALLVNAGVVYRNLDDAAGALAAFDEAAAIYRRLDDLSGLSNAALNRGLALHLNLGRRRAAETAYRQALDLARRSGDRVEEVQDLFYLGRLLLDPGVAGRRERRLGEAEGLFRRCLAIAAESRSAEGRWSALEGLGRIAAARGDLRLALRRLEAALAEIERVRAGLSQAPWRAGYFGDKRAVYGAAVEVLARLHRREPRGGFAERAFAVVQRAKARDLLDALGPAGSPAAPRSAAELRARLGGDVVLEYFVGEGRLYRWLLHGDRVELADVGPSAPLVAAVGRAHRALARGGSPSTADLAALSRGLLPPDLPPPGRSGELRIAPDGLLHYLPFELLPLRGTDRPLIEWSTVSYLPSASTLVAEPPPPASGGRRLVAFAPPAGPDGAAAGAGSGLAPLQARREVLAIAEIFGGSASLLTGDRATEAAFRRAVGTRPAVLHFATHAVVASGSAASGGLRSTAIYLLPAGLDDGLLTPPEIAAARGGASLTVLAACRTALVSPEDPAGTLASLTGAFLAAGSPAVVATLWDVEDEATVVFMEQLYAQLRRGLSPAAALRAVKQRLRADPRWNRPALWSAYVLVGRGSPVAPSRWPRLLVPAGLVVLAGAIALRALYPAGRSGRR
jgi:tetratricopeptide (TPR) repeat protein